MNEGIDPSKKYDPEYESTIELSNWVKENGLEIIDSSIEKEQVIERLEIQMSRCRGSGSGHAR